MKKTTSTGSNFTIFDLFNALFCVLIKNFSIQHIVIEFIWIHKNFDIFFNIDIKGAFMIISSRRLVTYVFVIFNALKSFPFYINIFSAIS